MNAHVMNPRTRLSAEQRAKLRKAISSHDGWNDYRRAHGLTMDAMSTEQLFAAADSLGIDVAIVAAVEAHSGLNPRLYGEPQVTDLLNRYAACSLHMPERDRKLCADVFETVLNRQNSEATQGQWGCILTRVVRAELAKEGQQGKKDAPFSQDEFDFWTRRVDAIRSHLSRAEDLECSAIIRAVFEQKRGFSLSETDFLSACCINGEKIAAEFQPKKAAPMLDKPTPAGASGDPAHALAGLIAQIAGQSMNPEQVARVVDERIQEALKGIPAVRIECKGFDGELRNVDGHQHPAFKRLLTAASSRMANGYAPNIWLAGPAGSGKTHAGHMLADAMGLAFHLNGAISMPHELLGFIDAAGNYHRTPFREAYEHGGIYMFDEVDGSDNSAILALNAALANGHATFPDMKVKRHPACIIVASANTWGLGATAEYVGRAKIDAAFLSRFPVRIAWEYDTALEVAISGNEAFARRVIAARERARAAGLKVLIDPRASQAGAALIAAGMKPEEAAELTYLANLSKDQRKIVEG